MSESSAPENPQKGRAGALLDALTGKIAKITALVGAIGGLVVAVFTQYDAIEKMVIKQFWHDCLDLEALVVPDKVSYGDWSNVRFRLTGENRCPDTLGIYVTYAHRPVSKDQPIRIARSVGEDVPECKGLPLQEPKCWDFKIPLKRGKVDWSVLPPPLELLGTLRDRMTIAMTWTVYNFDTKKAVRGDTTTIELVNNSGPAAVTAPIPGKNP
jgi:hypothetical protein